MKHFNIFLLLAQICLFMYIAPTQWYLEFNFGNWLYNTRNLSPPQAKILKKYVPPQAEILVETALSIYVRLNLDRVISD